MKFRAQTLFLPQGKALKPDPREAIFALGFLETLDRGSRGQGRDLVAFRCDETGGIHGTIEQGGAWPELNLDSDSYMLGELVNEKVWRQAKANEHPEGLVLGDILYRPIASPAPGRHFSAFIGVLLAPAGAALPAFHKRYDFTITKGAFSCSTATDVPALAYRQGVTPNHYLKAPGWDLGREEPAGLQSTLGLGFIKLYDQVDKLERAGIADDEIRRRLPKSQMIHGHLNDARFAEWKPLYREELAALGIVDTSRLLPLTEREFAMRDKAGSRAIARLLGRETTP